MLFTNGGITCWGLPYYGTSGIDSYAPAGAKNTIPVSTMDFIRFSDTIPAISISCGDVHVCAVHANYRVRCWGRNDNRQLGDGSTSAMKGSEANPLSSISSTLFVSFAPSINTIPVVQVESGV